MFQASSAVLALAWSSPLTRTVIGTAAGSRSVSIHGPMRGESVTVLGLRHLLVERDLVDGGDVVADRVAEDGAGHLLAP